MATTPRLRFFVDPESYEADHGPGSFDRDYELIKEDLRRIELTGLHFLFDKNGPLVENDVYRAAVSDAWRRVAFRGHIPDASKPH